MGNAGSRFFIYLALIGANLVYACESIFVKLASSQEQFSTKYFLYLAAAVCVLGIYALVWQQIIKRIPISEAYMFKGTTLIFVLMFSVILFGEHITLTNVIGAVMIISGIALFSRL